MELREKILRSATEMFFRYGIKRITMDDISREMGISKKTLYQSFKDKDEIISNMCDGTMSDNLQEMERISREAKDPIHEVIESGKHISRIFARINPVFFYEVKRFYPEAWKRFEQFKEKNLMRILETNLRKGIEMKIYRADLNINLMARYRIAQFDMALEPGFLANDKLSLGEIQLLLLDHFLHGITTIKGHKLVNKYKELKDDE